MTTHPFANIYGEHQDIKHAIHLAKQFTKNDQPVLITGEIGTGKSRFAQEMAHSFAAQASMKHIYCPIVDEATLQEAFTHAANHVIYLDEVSALSIPMQHQVIRFLEDSPATKIIASSSLSLEAMSVSSSFLPELFYRLNVLHIPLPPLEDRKTDIPILTAAFFQELNMTPDIDSSVWEVLQQYSFEGNVQELKNIVHYAAAILEGQTVFLHHLPPFVLLPQQTAGKGKKEEHQLTLMEKQEFVFLLEAIKSLNEKGEAASRRILSELSKQGDIPLTPQQVRSRLDDLEKKAYVTKGKGRAGTKITLEGLSFLKSLDGYIPVQ
ncbi:MULTISPECIES: sigma 54-interacting transcriptional regulator [Bacillus]|uniref:sigma 54-interacting transcriptional regulator n=1 Tax=Bacillus TaxID=1386 RepID=UPI0006FCA594|nr:MULTISPECIES: sigma 54-interacting transcriptional regulator [Bacillus]KQU12211.1 Fis family transcriptional regulator [Bacillus sp. Leaf49]MCY7622501.1 sigma 54-interacting transcriptional regulator [Bacillus altitudinis]MDI6562263.1 sigma 54-interacting transcriptional regulator [Bacillus altitudinis]MDX2365332.1 sigma 54-interacting transcriptional regulator [Bacillus altitudinis]MED0849339.1 sigma 54-interacting transcriptional regulator [Bacillus altitudinis]